MEKRIYRQSVTNGNFDKVAERFTMCGWKEIDIISSKPNHIEAIIFEWEGTGIPTYPNLSDL